MTSINIPHYHSTFPGESYLNVSLPDYAWERKAIVIKLVAAAIVFFYYLPKKYVFQTVVIESSANKADNTTTLQSSNGNNLNGSKKKRRGKNDKSKPNEEPPSQAVAAEPSTAIEIDPIKSSLCTSLGILSIFAILFLSPNNTFPSRTLLRAPLFTREECQRLVVMANAAAGRNADTAKRERKELLKRIPELVRLEKEVMDGKKNETEAMDQEGWKELRKLNSVLRGEMTISFVL
jgi:hypothetical protein